MNYQQPQLPPGHRLAGDKPIGDFWYAIDTEGYEYAVGCYSTRLDGGERILTETYSDGTKRQWRIDHQGHHNRVVDGSEMAEQEIPAGYQGVAWGAIKRGRQGTQAEKDCEEWGLNLGTPAQRKWLWLHGPRGTGKTSIASLVVRGAIERGLSCKMTDWGEFLRRIKSLFGTDTDTDLIEGAIAVDLLVLDDVGKDQPTDWAAQMLFEIVNGREQRGLPTMATSNYSVKALAARYGDDKGLAIADRIGRHSEIALGGKSNRS